MDKKKFLELVEKKKQKLEGRMVGKSEFAKKLEEAAMRAAEEERKEWEKEKKKEKRRQKNRHKKKHRSRSPSRSDDSTSGGESEREESTEDRILILIQMVPRMMTVISVTRAVEGRRREAKRRTDATAVPVVTLTGEFVTRISCTCVAGECNNGYGWSL